MLSMYYVHLHDWSGYSIKNTNNNDNKQIQR